MRAKQTERNVETVQSNLAKIKERERIGSQKRSHTSGISSYDYHINHLSDD